MGRRTQNKRKKNGDLLNYNSSNNIKEFILHDHKLLQKILGPDSKDLDYLEDHLPWPIKPQADLDAEWDTLCDEYSKLTGSRVNNDGAQIPSMADLCYYIGDWALKYVGTGNNIPTASGEPATCLPYWSRNQVLLYANSNKVCPPQFKQELDDEIFYLLHLAHKDYESDDDNEDNNNSTTKNIALEKVEILVRYFFFAGRDLSSTFDFISEEYEKRLRRGLVAVQQTPFCDLFCTMVFSCNGHFIKNPQEHLNKIKSFVVECEKLQNREFSWPPENPTFYEKLPLTDKEHNINSTNIINVSINNQDKISNKYDMRKLMKILGFLSLFVTLYVVFVVKTSS